MKTYRVVGAAPILVAGVEVKPGETITTTFEPSEERFLRTIGAIEELPSAMAVAPEPALPEEA